MAWIPPGAFVMGSDAGYPEEGPAHEVTVDGFWIDVCEVTNEQFAAFVNATGYVTSAERAPTAEDYPGVPAADLVAGSAVFSQPPGPVDLMSPMSWWAYTPGACWRHPAGPGSTLDGLERHPVVHVAYGDALAYAQWAGKELPTEAQWERAAHGGRDGFEYAWEEDGRPPYEHANTWHGVFPHENRKPRPPGAQTAATYPSNGFGLYDMIGNVWEWTRDFFAPGHRPPHAADAACCGPRNPTGPEHALSEPEAPSIPLYVLKGGSFLCAENYCSRYRPAARIPQAADSSTNHTGFRCVRTDLDERGRRRAA
jgi:formylglycine-generating enzyme required for sulfatase activity